MPAQVETAMIAERPAWWTKATVEEAQSAAEAIKLSGLDWNVIQKPIYVEDYQNEDGGPVYFYDEVPNYQANIRDSDNSVLAVVGKNYKPIQNAEWFGFMDILLGEGVKFETAGSLWHGKQVWMLALLPDDIVIAGDTIKKYILATNGHDGLHSGKMMAVDTRVVCWNTLNLALKEASRIWSIRHNQNLKGKEDEVRNYLQLAGKYFDAYKCQAEKLLKIKFSEKKFTGLVDHLFPFNEGEGMERINKNIEARRSLLWKEFNAEDLTNIRATGWGALQSLAALISHEPPGRKTATWQESRFNKVIITGEPLLKKALTYVLG